VVEMVAGGRNQFLTFPASSPECPPFPIAISRIMVSRAFDDQLRSGPGLPISPADCRPILAISRAAQSAKVAGKPSQARPSRIDLFVFEIGVPIPKDAE